MSAAKIIYTYTDEAPALATYSLLPIIKAFTRAAGVVVETRDISLAGRILAAFPDRLPPDRRQSDDLAELGQLAKTPDANIIKLPNISASIPQLKGAIKELQQQGYPVPDYPEEAQNDEEKSIKAAYAKVLGSAVNPVLREGNSDRRVATSVKQYARSHPHSMGAWSKDSKSHVTHMTSGDFYANEQSVVVSAAGKLRIELVDTSGNTTVLKDGVAVTEGDVIAASVMSRRALTEFFAKAIDETKAEGVLLSLHLKATMMKVSDPIMFGHAVRAYYQDVFDKYETTFDELGVDPDNGIGDVYAKIQKLPADRRAAIEADLQAVYAKRPPLAMVDSSKGITNLHVPSDVIIDASMPAAIRASGQMWGPDGKLHDMTAMIPDRSYAGIYQATLDDCREHGAFDVSTMGTVSNVGLMAQAAEEYGSHDKTFEIPAAGTVRVVDGSGHALFEHRVEAGDIWRMCRTRDLPIRDWVKLAVTRARATGHTAIFWLDETRAYDRNVIEKAKQYLKDHDIVGSRHPDLEAGRCDPRDPEARARRTRHDLGDRQRAARLPHGSVPDSGARHEREDAVDRAAARWRRPVRDRRGRLSAEARAAVSAGELPALGFARRIPRAGRVDRRPGRRRPAMPARRSSPTRSTRPTAESSTTTSRRSAKSASSTTAAVISTWRCIGRVHSRIRRATASSAPSSRRSRSSSSSKRRRLFRS